MQIFQLKINQSFTDEGIFQIIWNIIYKCKCNINAYKCNIADYNTDVF